MSFRARMTLLATGAVAIAIVFASAGLFVVVRDQLYSGIDNALHDDARASQCATPRLSDMPSTAPPSLAGSGYPQIVFANGRSSAARTSRSRSCR